ncbi:MAG: DUF4389 domain-containing protein [Alphaproteobacteria bacterium]|nr:DUF4389 domain-containing protein [Alphaproteobacteria bacterium]
MENLNEEELKKNVADKDTWLRLVYMVVFAFAFYLASGLLFAVSLLQFLAKLFSGKVLDGLLNFGHSLASYLGQIAQYLSYTSNEKPFPFSEFPTQKLPAVVAPAPEVDPSR